MSSMTNTITERRHRWSRRALLAAVAVVAMLIVLIGGCSLVMHKPHSAGSSNSVDDSAHPLTDDQAMAQVVQPAKEIVAAADLQSVSGGFSFASCNDQGDPPYMGEVTLSFLLRGDPDAYFQHVRAAMIAHGWNDGAPPGQHYFGTTLNKEGAVSYTHLARLARWLTPARPRGSTRPLHGRAC